MARESKYRCEGCGKPATLRVNGSPVCDNCVDLASDADRDEQEVEDLD